jgi:predicted DCC family thiol-disulfide oxidoreductase YuxK
MNEVQRTIIFFDGVCHLCNGFVDWLIVRDRKQRRMTYAPLQGETAKKQLPSDLILSPQTILVRTPQGEILARSSAVFYCLALLPGWPGWLSVFRFIPLGIRDFFYDIIARHRYSLFGQRDHCRRPLPEEKDYLLP